MTTITIQASQLSAFITSLAEAIVRRFNNGPEGEHWSIEQAMAHVRRMVRLGASVVLPEGSNGSKGFMMPMTLLSTNPHFGILRKLGAVPGDTFLADEALVDPEATPFIIEGAVRSGVTGGARNCWAKVHPRATNDLNILVGHDFTHKGICHNHGIDWLVLARNVAA